MCRPTRLAMPAWRCRAWRAALWDDPSGAVMVQLAAVSSLEDRPVGALADGQVDRPGAVRGASGIVTTLPRCAWLQGCGARARCPGPGCRRWWPATHACRSAPAGRAVRAQQAGQVRPRRAARRVRCGPPGGAGLVSSRGRPMFALAVRAHPSRFSHACRHDGGRRISGLHPSAGQHLAVTVRPTLRIRRRSLSSPAHEAGRQLVPGARVGHSASPYSRAARRSR